MSAVVLRACSGVAIALLGQAAHGDEWSTSAAVYAELADSNGEIAVGAHLADIDSNDLLDGTELLGMLTLRNEKERFAIMAGATFAAGSAEFLDPAGTFHDADLTQEMVEVTWSWRSNTRYELLAGLRYQSLGTDISSTAASGASTASFDAKSWLDPIIGARASWPVAATCTLVGRLDIGGFGVGSDMTWNALLAVEWNVGKHVGLVVGYRALDTDYADGAGDERFEFDVLTAGPLLGIRFDLSTQ